jgi:acyl-CoA reductase-like NAD-dependent aldehyde dehydrogenase
MMISSLFLKPCRIGGVRSLSSLAASQLNNPSLLQSLDDDASGERFAVYNPAYASTILAHVPKHDDAAAAIDRSQAALSAWCHGTTAMERSRLLIEWSRLILQNQEDLAVLLTLEAGKPLWESQAELNYARSFLDWFAAEAIRPGGAGGGFLIPTTFADADGSPRGQMMVRYQAVGVTGLIAPWNFPLAMVTRKVGPALAAGCTCLIKPSELTPLTAIALQTLAYEAGIPRDVLQVVLADKESTPAVGHAFCTHPAVAKVSFTGSTAVGKTLMGWSSGTIQKLSLELGGNNAFVVFEDADLEQAVTAAMSSKFRNAGQACSASDRFLVHESVHDAFVELLTGRVRATVKVGDGMDPATTMGPLITEQAAHNVHDTVQKALAQGATLVVGGGAPKEQFYEPTILINVTTDMDLWKNETFGPVVAVRSFQTEEEALEITNNSRMGLSTFFLTNDMARVFRFSQRYVLHARCRLVCVCFATSYPLTHGLCLNR